MIELEKGLNIIIGGQWGSEGKGKVAAALAEQAVAVVSDCMPNAGHTFYDGETKHVSKTIPAAAIMNDIPAFIGPGAVIKPQAFFEEIHKARNAVFIHPRTPILRDGDAAAEGELMRRVASTGQGCSGAVMRKIRRDKSGIASHSEALRQWVCEDSDTWRALLYNELERGPVLVESGQGFDLSLDSMFFPHCTSRNINVPAILDRIGGWWGVPVRIIGVIRTYPIRVGHVYDSDGMRILGHSGGHFSDQKEITWEQLGVDPEITTVTGRIRRVFDFSLVQMAGFVTTCRPDALVVNFADYLSMSQFEGWAAAIRTFGVSPTVYSDNPFNLADTGGRR